MHFALIHVHAVLGAKVIAVLVITALSVIGVAFVIAQPDDFSLQPQVDAIRSIITHVTTPRDETVSSDAERASLETVQR